ncbi:MAG: hypothetical protein ACJ741_20725 [Pyrinomonadaceae bacterium]
MIRKSMRQTFRGALSDKLLAPALCATVLSLSLSPGGFAAPPPPLESGSHVGAAAARPPLAEPNYVGFFDVGDCNVIAGWAADRNRLNTPINVSVFDGATLVTNVLANASRPDVGGAVGDNGLHGFNIPTPAALKNGQPHTISVRFEATTVELGTSPKTITCGSPVTPRDDVGTQVILALNFRLNNGAASTKERVVDLNFTATEKEGATTRKADLTQYRVLESPDERASGISSQPWIPITNPPTFKLAPRDSLGRRYGERHVAVQVKTAGLTSDVAGDTILLEPVLKEYRVSAAGSTHPLIQYAASQGFTFLLDPRSYQTCKTDCAGTFRADSSLASGEAEIAVPGLSAGSDVGNPVVCDISIAATVGTAVFATVLTPVVALSLLTCHPPTAPAPAGTCRTLADYLLFQGRSPNQFWRIKSAAVNGAYVVPHGANEFRVKFQHDVSDGSCNPPIHISIGDVVVEGPEEDDFVDPANPWKNAFVVRDRILGPLPQIRPGVPPLD